MGQKSKTDTFFFLDNPVCCSCNCSESGSVFKVGSEQLPVYILRQKGSQSDGCQKIEQGFN